MKPYVEQPHQVQAEQYFAATSPPVPGVCIEPHPPYINGEPHVHVAGVGAVALHDTDMIVWSSYDAEVILAVQPLVEFEARYEPPRPLQEIEGLWVCSVNTTIQNPTNGQIRLNAATVEATTILALHKLTDVNVDYSAALETAVIDDVIYIQSAKEAKNWARLTLTGECARQQEEWYRIPVVWTEGSGNSFIEGNNKLLINLELSHRVDRTQVIP